VSDGRVSDAGKLMNAIQLELNFRSAITWTLVEPGDADLLDSNHASSRKIDAGRAIFYLYFTKPSIGK
jgi:hypothetical protein